MCNVCVSVCITQCMQCATLVCGVCGEMAGDPLHHQYIVHTLHISRCTHCCKLDCTLIAVHPETHTTSSTVIFSSSISKCHHFLLNNTSTPHPTMYTSPSLCTTLQHNTIHFTLLHTLSYTLSYTPPRSATHTTHTIHTTRHTIKLPSNRDSIESN